MVFAEGAIDFNHTPRNVLFMDGHVEFIRHPGEFPLCKCWVMM